MTALFLVILGITFLFLAGEFLVKGAVSLSGVLKIPVFVIALTIVAFGTSAPELAISINASLGGYPGIAIGNVVGSNIANVLFAIPLAVLIKPINVSGIKPIDCLVLSLVTIIYTTLLIKLSYLSFYYGIFMLSFLFMYLTWTVFDAKKGNRQFEDIQATRYGLNKSIILIFIGLLGIILGAEILVKGSVELARMLGVNEAVIGLSIVAIGTSLPEVVASMIAAYRGSGGFLLGAIVGSNLFNLFGITGTMSIFSNVRVNGLITSFDLFSLVFSTILLIIISLLFKRINRIVAFLMLMMHIGYVVIIY